MDSSFSGVLLDPSKSSKMSMEEKRELVYELSKWSNGAPEMLQSWSRQEILQILCAELGKERKYTGLTKLKIIENLLKIVSEKKSAEHETVVEAEQKSSPATTQKSCKRQRKIDIPSRLPDGANSVLVNSNDSDLGNAIYCRNSACRANIRQEDAFCKRCSCCICYQYDDNKDPSLWLFCSSEPPFQGESCGLSCHLECAFRHEKPGIGKDGQQAILDGRFYCVSCGKLNDLLGCCRKQLMIAKETRRVDILCYRVSLSQKLLRGTKSYQKLCETVEEAVKKLEAEVGPLTGLPVKTARGIVNRLSSGPEVQRLCSFAVDSLDSILSNTGLHSRPLVMIKNSNSLSTNVIRFEDVCSTCLTVIVGSQDLAPDTIVGYNVWHRKANDMDYPAESTCKLFAPNTKFFVSGLTPSTEYLFKLVSFSGTRQLGMSEVQVSTGSAQHDVPKRLEVERSQSPTTNCSSLSNPSSVEDESNNIILCNDQIANREDNYLASCKATDKIVYENLSSDVLDSTSRGQEGTPADSIYVLGEECAIEINGCKPKSNVLKHKNKLSPDCEIIEMTTDNRLNSPVRIGMECVPFVGNLEAGLPITPCKLENLKDILRKKARSKHSYKDMDIESEKGEEPQGGSSSKKRSSEKMDVEFDANDRDFEYYVKVIRWLECEGHIEMNFRQKFLTWYSLRATPQEVRIVKVFVDNFSEDPASLAGQLVDTFSEFISSKRSTVVRAGFCMKLWH